ncbi:MAG: zinc-dependent metalloprotease [Flavipsychrobacter sp.]
MRKSLVVAALGSLVLWGNTIHAQNKKCGNEIILEEIAKDPIKQKAFEEYRAQVNEEVRAYSAARAKSANKTTGNVSIPVVFHFVLSQAQIDQIGGQAGIYKRVQQQITVLNSDFNATNIDINNVPTAFKSLIGNAEMNFGLAHRMPDGTGTTGIEILVKPANFTGYSASDNNVKNTNGGGLDAWDHNQYLNVWVTNLTTTGLLGYAYSPQFTQQLQIPLRYQGAVIHYGAIGVPDGSPNQYFVSQVARRSRTLVHELGHFFNLNHIWGNTAVGSGNCLDDDDVGDTPRQEDANQSVCPTGVKANCSNNPHVGGEMYMNYMDYTGDACTIMFTKGQVERMRAQIAPGGASYGLTLNGDVMTWPTSISSIERDNTFSIAPNPSNGVVNINFIEQTNNLQYINVLNITGQLVEKIVVTEQKANYSVDLTNAPKGVYVLQLGFDAGIISKKVIVQ